MHGGDHSRSVGPDDLLTEKEAADFLRITPRMLADRRRAKKISAIKDGHYIRYKISDLLAYQDLHRRAGMGQEPTLDDDALLAAIKKKFFKKPR